MMARVKTMKMIDPTTGSVITDLTPAEVMDEYIAEASKVDLTGKKEMIETTYTSQAPPEMDTYTYTYKSGPIIKTDLKVEPIFETDMFQVEAKIFDLDSTKPLRCKKCGHFVSKGVACQHCLSKENKHLYTCVVCKKLYVPYVGNYLDMTCCCCAECFAAKMRKQVSYEKRDLAEELGLDAQFMPFIEAADFYLLLNLSIDHPEYKTLVDAKADRLTERLSKYMFYAIGGEVRHFPWKFISKHGFIGKRNSLARGTYAVRKALGAETGQTIVDFLATHRLIELSRNQMWRHFPGYAKKLGRLNLLKACKALFDLDNIAWDGHSVGGASWARIAQTLIDYETGEISKILFVDTAFALKHNNALHLNKVWPIHHLQNVLDLNFSGRYKELLDYASNEIKEYYVKVL